MEPEQTKLAVSERNRRLAMQGGEHRPKGAQQVGRGHREQQHLHGVEDPGHYKGRGWD